MYVDQAAAAGMVLLPAFGMPVRKRGEHVFLLYQNTVSSFALRARFGLPLQMRALTIEGLAGGFVFQTSCDIGGR